MARSPGVTLEVLPAWDLGWKDRVVQLLAAHPELVNHQRGAMATTLLHEAVERNDPALAQVLLTAQSDVTIIRARFGGTPLDWVKHIQRTALIELIERYQANPLEA